MTPEHEERFALMEEFRQDMSKVDPSKAGEESYPAFKLRPLVFKYEHAAFLFRVWLAGRNSK